VPRLALPRAGASETSTPAGDGLEGFDDRLPLSAVSALGAPTSQKTHCVNFRGGARRRPGAVSPAASRRYFPIKHSLVFPEREGRLERFRELLSEAPELGPYAALRHAVLTLAAEYEGDRRHLLTQDALEQATPELLRLLRQRRGRRCLACGSPVADAERQAHPHLAAEVILGSAGVAAEELGEEEGLTVEIRLDAHQRRTAADGTAAARTFTYFGEE